MTRRVSVRANLLAIASMLALLLPAGLAAPAAVLAADPDIITSVDFDDGTTGTWTQSGSPTLTFVDDGAGGQALSILRAQDFEGIQSPTGLLEHDVVYTFSMRARLPEGTVGTTDVRFVVKPQFNWVGNTTINGSGWTTISGTYTLPDAVDPAASQVYVGSTNQAAPYTILVDDILITAPAAPPTTDIISSVDFDDGTNGDWTQSGSPTLTFVDDGAGGQALSILRAQDFEGIQSPTGLLEHDVVYTFSMRARLPEGTAGSTDVRFVVKPQLQLGRQHHDQQLRLDDDQRHLHAARRGRPRGKPGLHRQRQPGRAVHDPRRRHPDHGTRGAAADGDGPQHGLRGRPRRLGPAWRRPGRPDRRPDDRRIAQPDPRRPRVRPHSQGDGIGHDVTGIMDPGTTYVVTAWVKFAAGNPTDTLWLSMRRTNGGTDSFDTLGQFTAVSGTTFVEVRRPTRWGRRSRPSSTSRAATRTARSCRSSSTTS